MDFITATVDSDADLLAGIAGGEQRALGELARRYVDFVYAAAVRQTRDQHLAEDVTQAVFLVLAKKAGSVRGPALPAWLHQTTRYAAANATRARRRRTVHEQAAARPEGVMPYVLPEPDPLLPMLDDAIASLQAKDRQAVIGRYLRGQEVADVATTIGITPAAAQKRLERAVVKLRTYFTRHGVRGGAVTLAAVAAALTAATSAHAAPPTLAAAATTITAPTASSLATAKGVLLMLTWTKVKVVAGVFACVCLLGGGIAATCATQGQFTHQGTVAVTNLAPPMAASQPATTRVVGRLKNGVSIELLGSADAPSTGKPWRGPDGSPLAERPYATPPSTPDQNRDRIEAGSVSSEYAFAIQEDGGANGPATVRAAAVDWGDPRQARWFRLDDTDPWRRRPPRAGGSRTFAMLAIDRPDHPVTLGFCIAAGAWVTRVASRPDQDTLWPGTPQKHDPRLPPTEDGGLGFSRPFDRDGSACVVVSEATQGFFDERRVVAIATDGSVHSVYNTSPGGQGTRPLWMWYTAEAADLPLSRLASFELQERPFDQWIEFRDVLSHGGTIPNVATSDDAIVATNTPFAATLPDGTRPQIVAFGDARTGQWWKPDGTAMEPPPYAQYANEGMESSLPKDPAVRAVWVITTCDRQGKYFWNYTAKGELVQTSHYAKGLMDGNKNYVGHLMELKPGQTTGEITLAAPSRPTAEVKMTAGPDGRWDPATVVRQTVPRVGEVVVWLPHDEPADTVSNITAGAAFRAYLPDDATGERSTDFVVARKGGKPALMRTIASPNRGSASWYALRSDVPLADLRSLGVSIEFYDEAVTFAGLSLWPGKVTQATITAKEPVRK